jgi:hypothetical protein
MNARRSSLAAILVAVLAACVGTTGGDLLSFQAYGAGPEDIETQPTFTNGQGWTVTLTKAKLHVGALYLNRSVPVSGGQERQCFLPGTYVAQVLQGVDLDVLSSRPQRFPGEGDGIEDRAVTGEVWLTGARIDSLDDHTTIADVAGAAVKDGVTRRFEATVTIGKNRVVPSNDPARPGSSPLCAERIVTPIPVDVTPRKGGALLVRVDPRRWFANVDFGELETVSKESDLVRFSDESTGQAATNLYRGLRASTGVYTFRWLDAPPGDAR